MLIYGEVTDDNQTDCLNIEDDDKQAVNHNSPTVSELQREQLSDDSLKGASTLAKGGNGLYFIRDDLLFRYHKVCGQDVECLDLPSERRKYVTDVAYAVSGGHFNCRKNP